MAKSRVSELQAP